MGDPLPYGIYGSRDETSEIVYHYTNLTVVCESVTGRSTEAIRPARKSHLFLCIVGLGRYTRQPTDSPAMALAVDYSKPL